MTGGGGNGLDPADASGKTHLVYVGVESCRGRIRFSGGAKLCLEEGCDKPTHMADRVSLGEGGKVLIKVPKKAQAYVYPALEADDLPEGFNIDSLEDSPRPAGVLRALLLAHATRPTPNGPSGSVLAFASPPEGAQAGRVKVEPGNLEDAFIKAAIAAQTPGRKGKSLKTEGITSWFQSKPSPENLASLKSNRNAATMASDVSSLGGTQQPDAERLIKMIKDIDLIGAVAIELGTDHKALLGKTHDALSVLDDRLAEADTSMKLMLASIGQPGAEFEGSTVWDSLGEVNEQAVSEEQMSDLVHAHMKQSHAHVKSLLNKVQQEHQAALSVLEGKVRNTFSTMGTSFQNLIDAVNALKNSGSATTASSSSSQYGSLYGNLASQGVPSPSTMESRVMELEARVLGLSNASISAAGTQAQAAGTAAAVQARLADQDQKIKVMERKVSGDKAFKADDRVYTCVEDVMEMIDDTGLTRIGGYIDMFAAFVLMVSPPCTGEQHANRVVSSSKAERGAADSDLLATLTHERPPFMFQASSDNKSQKLAPKSAGFGINLKRFDDYDETSNSMKEQIFSMLQDLVTALSSELDFTVASDRLKACMIRKSHAFAVRLLNFFTTFYRTMVTKCNYPKLEAWNLTGRVAVIIMAAQRSIRARALGIEDIRTTRSKAIVIWTMMQSLNAVEEILEKEVQSHPVIMKEIQEFQLEHRVDASQLTGVVDDQKENKAQLKEQAKQITLLSDKVTKLIQDMGNLKTEVKRIASKG